MEITIREIHFDDIAGVLELYGQPDMDNGKTLTKEEAKSIYKRMLSYPNYKVYAAVDHSQIVGTFALAIMDNLANQGAPSGLIEDVVVKTEWQGRGIGKQMMNYAMEVCRHYGCYKAALSSNLKRKDAHAFYEKLGFKNVDTAFLLSLIDPQLFK